MQTYARCFTQIGKAIFPAATSRVLLKTLRLKEAPADGKRPTFTNFSRFTQKATGVIIKHCTYQGHCR
jgi:hypothetical protein